MAAVALAQPAAKPFGSVPFLIPARGDARLEAEAFDRGPEGVAYHDNDAANAGRQFRAEDGTDIGLCNDASGGYRIGWIAPGEWLRYTVRVSSAGRYSVTLRVSSRGSVGSVAGKLHIEDAAGTNLTGEVSIPGTADAWQDVQTAITLTAGEQPLKVVFDSGGYNLNYLTFSPLAGDAPAPAAQQPAAGQGQSDIVIVGGDEPVTDAAPSNGRGVFSADVTIGADAGKGQVAVSAAGEYVLRGGRAIGAKSDSAYLVSNKVAGDGQLVAKVESVEGSGSAGLMYRESADPDARFAAVLVTGNKGAIFQRRTEKGGNALSATAIGARPPVWVRLVRTGTNFSGFYAAQSSMPNEGDWKAIGSAKTVPMADEALAGLVSGNDGQATLASVAAGGTAAVAAVDASAAPAAAANAADGQLTGTVIGTAGSFQGSSSTRDKVFDGDLNTFFDPPEGTGTSAWIGLDFGSARRITRVAYCPRGEFPKRMQGGTFQASNSPNFASDVVDLYVIPGVPASGQLTAVDVTPSGGYRYFRYTGGTEHLNVAEIKVYGETSPATGAQLPGSGAAATGRVANVEDKAFDLTARTIDWVHWTKPGETNRKQGVAARIGDLNGERNGFVDNHVRYSWTDGTPQRRVNGTIEAIYNTGSFSFTVRPGDTRPHTLMVFVGGWDSLGELTVSVPGAPPYVDRGRGIRGDHHYFAYTLQVRVSRPSDEVRIEWKLTEGGGNIQLHAAALY